MNRVRLNDNAYRTSLERMSSGLRINSAKDDPMGIGFSSVIEAQFRGTQEAIHNLEDGLTWLDVRSEALNQALEYTLRLRDLAVRAATDATLTNEQRELINQEATDLVTQMEQTGRNHQVTGHKSLFDPGMLDVIWVLDVTGSMGTYAAQLIADAASMYDQFAAEGYDLQMGITGYATNAGVWGSSLSFHDNSGGFVGDVTTLKGVIDAGIAGGTENGLTAVNTALALGGLGGSFREDAQRVVILLTDEDLDDFGITGFGSNDETLSLNPGAEALRQATADNLIAADAMFFDVGVVTGTGGPTVNSPDQDLQDVMAKVGRGGNYVLDGGGAWVNSVTSSLLATGGPWDSGFQAGPNSSDYFEVKFETVTSVTSGAAGVSLATAASAQASIDTLDSAIDFIQESQVQAGDVRNAFQRAIGDLEQQKIKLMDENSKIADADYAAEIANMAKSQIVQSVTTSIMTQGNISYQQATRMLLGV